MKLRSKEEAYSSKQWKDARKKKLETQKYCQLCQLRGIQKEGECVHHIIKFWDQDKEIRDMLLVDQDNLCVLCNEHHNQIHKKQQMLFPEQLNYLKLFKDYISTKYLYNGYLINYTTDKNK